MYATHVAFPPDLMRGHSTILTFAVMLNIYCGSSTPNSTAAQTATLVASAESITVANASFEQPTTPANSFITTGPPTSWVRYGSINDGLRSVGVLNPNTTLLYLDSVPHGSNVGVVFLIDNNGNHAQFNNSPAGLEQTLTATLQTNSKYTLKVYVGNINQDTPATPFQFIGFPNYRIELLAGGVVIASDNNSLAPGEGRFLLSTVTATIGATHAQANQAIGIRLLNFNSAVGIEVNFDSISLMREF